MYPITNIPIWLTIVGVIVAIGLSYWVANKDNSARPLGLGAVFISLVTASSWFISLPGWTAVVVIIATLSLFIVGMLAPETIDDPFHYGAVFVAVFGKLVAGSLPLIWARLTGEVTVPEVTVPVFVLALLLIVAFVGFLRWRSKRLQHLAGRLNPAN
jgi:hypothetical protein